jgi:hypothetical protein
MSAPLYRQPNAARGSACRPFVGENNVHVHVAPQRDNGPVEHYVGTVLAVSRLMSGSYPWVVTMTAVKTVNGSITDRVAAPALTFSTAQIARIYRGS